MSAYWAFWPWDVGLSMGITVVYQKNVSGEWTADTVEALWPDEANPWTWSTNFVCGPGAVAIVPRAGMSETYTKTVHGDGVIEVELH